MIAHIKGRPCSIVRAPDGINGETILPAPRHAGRVQPARTGQGVAAIANPICRSTGSRRWRRWRRSAGWSCIPGIARPTITTRRGGWCSISIPRRTSNFREVIEAAKEMRAAADGAGPRKLLQDHRRQGAARGDAAAAWRAGDKLGWNEAKAFAQAVCQWMANDDPERYLAQHVEEAAQGQDLPRLSAQRPDVDGGRRVVAACARGRHRLDAADLAAGARRSRSEEVYGAHRAGAVGEDESVGWI